ncbi:OLC1v1024662C1 [Oldenlandia corymbosa var. corymbosa]|uniref:OLC1v1024662C1 n=1 Tax=Oldenlandia corymbosa var. corymbosa TaxID=529605 RepID=A0AAV1C4N8_OLDCO|nr:OLC1v1024662C1 [Oldenlandia corymbosa var. corymbosa]
MPVVSVKKQSLATPLSKAVWIGGLAALFLILAWSQMISSWSAWITRNDIFYGVKNRLTGAGQKNNTTPSMQQETAEMHFSVAQHHQKDQSTQLLPSSDSSLCEAYNPCSKQLNTGRFSGFRYNSSYKFDLAPDGLNNLQLDVPDEQLMQFLPQFDVLVLSSGHWFGRKSAYVLNNTVVGGSPSWWPKSREMKVDLVEAFRISVETILSAIVTHPNYCGLTIVRTFSPDHYERGAWNTGGSCTGKVWPIKTGEIIENEFTTKMHNQQV